jgi:hypothetical protein
MGEEAIFLSDLKQKQNIPSKKKKKKKANAYRKKSSGGFNR